VLKELDLSCNAWDYDSDDCEDADGPGFAQELAHGIKDNGALSVLSLKNNSLGTKEAGKALGEMLTVNSVLKELDLSDNAVSVYVGGDGPGFAQELALGIKDNGALTKFDISNNCLYTAGSKALAEGLKGNQVMAELNLAGNEMGKESGDYYAKADMSGIIALAGVIPGMGALTSLDISSNNLGAEQERDLQRICVAGGIKLTK
jgi:hypothetical protein